MRAVECYRYGAIHAPESTWPKKTPCCQQAITKTPGKTLSGKPATVLSCRCGWNEKYVHEEV